MKSLVSFLSALLLTTLVCAQSVPNGGTITQGQVWTAPQWTTAWQSKADALNGVLTSPSMIGAVNINGLPPVTYPQTLAEITANVIPSNFNYAPGNALRYGADPTGAIDSTAAMNAAHSTGYQIYYPIGNYRVNSTVGVTIPCGGITGDGAGLTIFLDTGTGASNTFTYNCAASGGLFTRFSIQPATTKSGGYAFVVTAPSFESSNARFENLYIVGMPNGINFVKASQWTILDSNFLNCIGDCVTVNNTNNADSGDSAILGTIFNNSTSTSAVAVHQIVSGGLRLVGDKFNNGGVGYLLDLPSTGVGTSDLLVTGCSFENAHFSGIQFQRTTGSFIFTNVSIVGNQFYVASSSNSSTGIFSGGTSAFLYYLTVVGNIFNIADTGAAAAISINYVQGATISGNTIGTAGGSSTGLSIGANNLNVSVPPGTNTFLNAGTNLSGQANTNYFGTTGSIGGSPLTVGTCTSGTATVAGSTTGMAVSASPVTYPGDGIFWHGYVSAAGTVTVKVCATASITPTAGAYNVRVLQ